MDKHDLKIISGAPASDLIDAVNFREFPGEFRGEILQELSNRRARKQLSGGSQRKQQELAEKYATDGRAPTELRHAAIVALGRISSGSQQPTLLKALQSSDPVAVKLVAAALGRIGDKKAMAALERSKVKLKVGGSESESSLVAQLAQVKQTVEFSKTLLSYRYGLGTHLIEPTRADKLLEVNSGDPEEDKSNRRRFGPDRIGPKTLEKELHLVSEELRAIMPFYKEKAWTFDCGGRAISRSYARNQRKVPPESLLVFNRNFLNRKFLVSLRSRNALVAVILTHHTCNEGRFITEYFLSNPAASELESENAWTGSIVGVRPMGEKIHTGGFAIYKDRVEFTLRSENRVDIRAIDIAGSFDGKEIKLKRDHCHIRKGYDAKGQAAPMELEPERLGFERALHDLTLVEIG